ncbi:hypothetical protein MRX96_044086 [Rhipicephalus microplus]
MWQPDRRARPFALARLLHIPRCPCVPLFVKAASCAIRSLKTSREDDTGATTMQRSSGPDISCHLWLVQTPEHGRESDHGCDSREFT